MKKNLLILSLLTGAIFFADCVIAQQAGRTAYAITDVQQQNANWVYLRQFDMKSGQFSASLINGLDNNQVAFNATTKKEIVSFTQNIADKGFNPRPAFSSGVAALALDKRNNRLWYTPMFIDQLRYIDLKTMKVFYVTDSPLTRMTQKSSDQGNIVTRMVIASDGFGYAMTNDGMHLLKFSTGKRVQITDLGAIVDDQANKTVSIHNSCSSYGGDIIADDDGNLIVFSAMKNVFKINIESKIATHLGAISGLPNGFSVNGAAVNADNKILVGSAMEASSFFTVDLKSLVASPYKIEGTVWHSSDLASSNLLATGNAAKGGIAEVISKNIPANTGSDKISIYPNPVTNNQFAIQFTQLDAGNYTVFVTDVMGRQVLQQQISLSGDNQTQQIKIDPAAARGIYLIKVTDQASKSVFSTKLVLQ
ncbi:MAG: T9SS type A sorting domain-containing protein [Chitinophagaceae bacterium]